MKRIKRIIERFSVQIILTLCVLLIEVPVTIIAQGPPSAPLGPYGNLGATLWSQGTGATITVPAINMTGIATGAPGSAATYTTDTAANLCALFPFVAQQSGASANFAWDWYLKDTSGANAISTFTAGSGVTLVGTGTVAANNVRHYKIVLTNCVAGSQAATIYSLETAAF